MKGRHAAPGTPPQQCAGHEDAAVLMGGMRWNQGVSWSSTVKAAEPPGSVSWGSALSCTCPYRRLPNDQHKQKKQEPTQPHFQAVILRFDHPFRHLC